MGPGVRFSTRPDHGVAAIVLVAYALTAGTPDTTDYLFLSALAASLALLRIMHDADPDIIPAVETDQW